LNLVPRQYGEKSWLATFVPVINGARDSVVTLDFSTDSLNDISNGKPVDILEIWQSIRLAARRA
jgi:hypothetical protein